MKILHRYLLTQLLRNCLIGLLGFTFLFLMFDFLDRLDNVISEKADVLTIIMYFGYKIPQMINLMLPVAMMFATLFTYGILAKNSELTAMRAGGAPVLWLARPLIACCLVLSIVSLFLGEFVVPFSERRQRDLYNIEIMQKDKRGSYSQSDFWWRHGDRFYAVNTFDSRTNTMLNMSTFDIASDWQFSQRTDALTVKWIDSVLGWGMRDVTMYRFNGSQVESKLVPALPLPIKETPRDFYDLRSDDEAMGYFELRRFIREQRRNGIATSQYIPDLYHKLSAPFIILIVPLVVLPFALKPARSGSLAVSTIAAFSIAFSYYAVDSFSIAMGRAEILHPLLAAWAANIVMGLAGLILNLGAEAPS